MPYASNDALPDPVKRVLPSDKARSLWRRVFNESMKRGYQEGRSFGAAYAAIDSAGFKKDPKSGIYSEKRAMQKRQISEDVFTTAIEAVQRAHQLGLGLVAHITEGPDGQAFYMPGATHDDYLEMVGEAGMIAPDGAEVEDPTGDLIETVIEAAIGAILEAQMDKRAAKIIKINDEARIVWGWASVVSVAGEPMVDRQGDIISPEVMTKAADRFMEDVRVAKAMHEGAQIGEVIHSFPLTKELGEALGVHSALEGWIVAMKVHDDSVWNRVKSGELAAFSIGGMGKRNAV